VIAGYFSGKERPVMSSSQRDAVSRHRRRLKQQGVVRLEVKVRREDTGLVRRVAAALVDPERSGEARAFLRGHFDAPPAEGLKALLAAAPLEGIDLSRERDAGRDLPL
jgi:DNA-binding transcriptional ArsR family regulator